MILTLGIAIIILILIFWIMTTYFSWKVSEGYEPKLVTIEFFEEKLYRLVRLFRRGTYYILLKLRKVYSWIQKNTRKIFIYLVPSAKVAFAEKDELAGLTHGPSSFFLKEITDSKNGTKKRLSKSKKML